MTKNEKKELRKSKLIRFRQDVLPILDKVYTITSHGPINAPDTMYKIIISDDKSYDYYPMSERMRVKVGDKKTWHDISIDEIYKQASNLK